MFMATTKKLYCNDLSQKLKKIHTMKWLLNLENQDVNKSEEELQKEIDKIAHKNFARLTMINHYLKQIPNIMERGIENVILATQNKQEYKKCFNSFKSEFKNNTEFQELDQYILVNITQDALHGLSDAQLNDMELLKDLLLKIRQAYYILLFNIIYDQSNEVAKFDCTELVYNFPLLVHWINKNKFQPIKNLTNDDCEVIAGLFYGIGYDEILKLNLSSFAKNYKSINQIVLDLPAKFQVKNITQVLFRLLLLKPLLWSYPSHEEVVAAIKGIPNVL